MFHIVKWIQATNLRYVCEIYFRLSIMEHLYRARSPQYIETRHNSISYERLWSPHLLESSGDLFQVTNEKSFYLDRLRTPEQASVSNFEFDAILKTDQIENLFLSSLRPGKG